MVLQRSASVVPTSGIQRIGLKSSFLAGALTISAAVATFGPAAPAQAARASCHGVRATIVGTAASNVIHGTPGRDVINGLGGNDTIYGRGGNDLVCGGSGADRLYGGRGHDRLYGELDRLHRVQEDGVERVGDTLRGGPGNDHLAAGRDTRPADIVVEDVYAWDQSAHGVHIDLRTGKARGEGRDTFTGRKYSVVASAHADVVEGSSRGEKISTGAGRDVVRARGGRDYVDVDASREWPKGAADRVWAGRGDDQISAGGGQDHLSGGPGNDSIEAWGKGNDVLIGGPGRDSLYAELGDTAGPQAFKGGSGLDFLQLESSWVRRKGETSTGDWTMATGAMAVTFGHTISLTVAHIDQASLSTPRTAWTVTGTDEGDSVWGDTNSSLSSVSFNGLDGDDLFDGTSGDDLFDGGPGNDHSLGMYNGDDTCISVETIDGDDCEHVS